MRIVLILLPLAVISCQSNHEVEIQSGTYGGISVTNNRNGVVTNRDAVTRVTLDGITYDIHRGEVTVKYPDGRTEHLVPESQCHQ